MTQLISHCCGAPALGEIVNGWALCRDCKEHAHFLTAEDHEARDALEPNNKRILQWVVDNLDRFTLNGDTPRTDDEESTYAQARLSIQRSETGWLTLVPADFARTLERELATAKHERDAALADKERLDWLESIVSKQHSYKRLAFVFNAERTSLRDGVDMEIKHTSSKETPCPSK